MEYYSPPPPPSYEAPPVSQKEQYTWAMFAHLSGLLAYTMIPFGNILAPFLIWLMNKDTMPFVDDQAKEALNFQITIMIYLFVSGLSCLILIGFVLLPIVAIFHLVGSIVGAMKAQQGIAYRYPMTFRFI